MFNLNETRARLAQLAFRRGDTWFSEAKFAFRLHETLAGKAILMFPF